MQLTSSASERPVQSFDWDALGRRLSEARRLQSILRRCGPLGNHELAVMLGCSNGQASKIVGRHQRIVRRSRLGRRAVIALL